MVASSHPNNRTSSLRQLVLFGAFLGILLPALTLGYFQAEARFAARLGQRTQTLDQYVKLLENGLGLTLWNLDRAVATKLLDGVMQDPDVVRVVVIDEQSRTFAEIARPRQNPPVHQREVAVHYDGHQVGALRIEISLASVHEQWRNDLISFGLAILAQVVVSFVLIWALVERRIIRPLVHLQAGALRFARGDLDEPLLPTNNDEIGQLSAQLERMRADLKQLIAEREARTAELQAYVARLDEARLAIEAERSRFAGLFHHAPMPFILVRYPEGVIVEVNPAWCTQLGYGRDEVVGRTTTEVGIWVDLDERRRVIGGLLEQSVLLPVDVRLRHHDGRVLTFELSAAKFEAGEQEMFVFNMHDVTHEREMESQLRDLNVRLEERVQSRTQSLEAANRELNGALASLKTMQDELIRRQKMAALGSLVAGIAHELNTPIGTSVTVASTLAASTAQVEEAVSGGRLRKSDLADFLEKVNKGAEILMRTLAKAATLITSFKQVAVDQSGDLRRVFKLREVIDEVALTLEPNYRRTGHRLFIDDVPDVTIDGYPGSLGQVLTNFINNSLAHAFDGREAGTMRIGARQIDAAHVELRYQDDGVGINTEDLKRVFDPFFTTKLGKGGSGLGMHIVYNIVTNMLGGTIALDSVPGQGVRITLVLPVVAPERASEPIVAS